MTMIIINVCLLIVALILAIVTHKQGKLLLKYDKCLKDKGYMRKLFFLANLAKTCGHDMIINYETVHDYTHVLFYKKGWYMDESPYYTKVINDDETFEEAIKELERLIK